MNKYIIQNESGKQFIAGPVTIEKPSIPVEFNEIEESKAMFRYEKKLALYDDHILSLPRYEWQGEKREVGDVVELGKDFKWGLKAYGPPMPETEEDYQMALHDAKHELPPSPKKVAISLSKALEVKDKEDESRFSVWKSVEHHTLPLETPILLLHQYGVEAVQFHTGAWRYWYTAQTVDVHVLQTAKYFMVATERNISSH